MIGKWFGIHILRNLAKIIVVGALIFLVSSAVGFTIGRTVLPTIRGVAGDGIFAQPTYNWYVCGDLGFGTVPGVPDPRQILRLCHNQGWEIRTYCTQPSLPAPPIGMTCSLTPDDTYWCGDNYQLLREFALDVTPTSTSAVVVTATNAPPTQTPPILMSATPSWTPTFTINPSDIPTDTPPPTSTPRLTRTPSPTVPTNTPLPSLTGTVFPSQTIEATITGSPAPTNTPQLPPTGTVSVSQTSTWTPAPTLISMTPTSMDVLPTFTPIPTQRPRPGGDGNLSMIVLMGGGLVVMSFMIGSLLLVIFKQKEFALDLPFGSSKSQLLPIPEKLIIRRGLMLIILVGLILASGYILVSWMLPTLVGLPISGQVEKHPMEIVMMMTSTPFQPRHPTPVYDSELENHSLAPFQFQGVDFSPQSGKRSISIDPAGQKVNQGEPITLSFFPAETCEFGDQQACVSSHRTLFGNILFLTIHSGYRGEGQPFRHAVEGTGINRAAFSLAAVETNLEALQDANVVIARDGNEQGGMVVKGVIRIPASQLEAYFNLPIEEALELAGSIAPEIWQRLDLRQPILAFETCGWKIPSEPGSKEVANTTGSVYVVLIQPR